MCKQLLAFLTIIAITLSSCPANYKIDSLVAGKHLSDLRFSCVLNPNQQL